MGRAKKKQDNRGPLQRAMDNERVANDQSFIDVLTPEQLASGDYEAKDKGRRYYRLQHIDRLHKNGRLTYEQHQAAAMYRDLYDAGRYDAPRTQDWTRVRGENVVNFTMPTKQQDARDRFNDARKEIPRKLVGFVDRLLLRNEWPKVHHRAAARNLTDLRNALDTLAAHFRFI